MDSSLIQFVREKLNEPGVSLAQVAEATGLSRRSLQLMRAGSADNAWTTSVEALARHFGYRFEAVPVNPPKH